VRHIESATQRGFVARCRLDARTRYIPIFAIPNGGKRGAREAARMKGEGVLAGVPDLFVPRAKGRYHGLFLEFKSPKGRLSPQQTEVGRDLSDAGYLVRVVRTAAEAWTALIEYLEGGAQ
jgi:hypothetical protein